MYAAWICGLYLRLNQKDKEGIKKNGEVSTLCDRYEYEKGMEVIFRVAPTPESDHSYRLLEPGWHIDTIPSENERYGNPSLEQIPIKIFRVTVDEQVWKKLTTEGYLVTRSKYDRIDVVYWEPGVKFTSTG